VKEKKSITLETDEEVLNNKDMPISWMEELTLVSPELPAVSESSLVKMLVHPRTEC